MKNVILFIIILLALLSVTYIGYVKFITPEPTVYQTINQPQNEKYDLVNALKTGTNSVCVRDQDGIKTEYVISGNKTRTKTTSSSEIGTANWVNNGRSIYIWNEGQTNGIQINYFEEDTNINNNPTEIQDLNFKSLLSEDSEVNCHPSERDDSEFIPPATVNFTLLKS